MSTVGADASCGMGASVDHEQGPGRGAAALSARAGRGDHPDGPCAADPPGSGDMVLLEGLAPKRDRKGTVCDEDPPVTTPLIAPVAPAQRSTDLPRGVADAL